ncbi:NADH-quinone oxidoreductase subunit K [Roseomonas rosulenta]|uniref:NADH-quinone oxidoreductase subunit K n=1 Tax=Roseomonas rosulenta TaxID=2748667 RepID=UPI0018DFA5CA|nr:NADH-quinone oxidoreductase subunit K [Roseomonas rosulenta]
MTATLFGLLGALLAGIGLFGLLVRTEALLRILAFNLLGGGIFLVFGAVARRGAGAGFAADPVPQAIILTGIVVAFAATTLAVALVVRIATDGDAGPGVGAGDAEAIAAGGVGGIAAGGAARPDATGAP